MGFSRRQGMGTMGGDWRQTVHNDAQNTAVKEAAKAIRKVRKEFNKKLEELPKTPISIRPMCIDDAAYVLDSWANSYRRSPTTGPIEREVFNIEQRARINRLVTKPHARVFVACDSEQTKLIRGWVCFEAPLNEQSLPILHYVCVHPSYQMQGIGTALVALVRQTARDPEAHIWATHETQPMRHIREKWNILYNPYLLEVGAQK